MSRTASTLILLLMALRFVLYSRLHLVASYRGGTAAYSSPEELCGACKRLAVN